MIKPSSDPFVLSQSKIQMTSSSIMLQTPNRNDKRKSTLKGPGYGPDPNASLKDTSLMTLPSNCKQKNLIIVSQPNTVCSGSSTSQ